MRISPFGATIELQGPVGERNTYECGPRGKVLAIAASEAAFRRQISAALATGNRLGVEPTTAMRCASALAGIPVALREWIAPAVPGEAVDAVLFDGPADELIRHQREFAKRPGPIVPIAVASASGDYPISCLVRERTISVNTAAAGGNASLMSIG